MTVQSGICSIPLPKGWKTKVQLAMVQVVALAHRAMVQARGRAASGRSVQRRLLIENERLRHELALTQEELRIKDARMERVTPAKRPYYTPVERLAILEMRAARGWSLADAAQRFLVTEITIASWEKRLDGSEGDRLLALQSPVNKFPDFVRYTVQRLKVLCPTLGKVKIAQILCRAGLHLGATTVGRILKERPAPALIEATAKKSGRIVTAKYPNHVWHVDLTVVPTTMGGFWTSYLPFTLPQCWPFCWWVAVTLHHFSRRAMGVALFRKQPTSEMVRAFLGRTISQAERQPKYLICDQGTQFDCKGFRAWSDRRGIKIRYGAVGKQGSIAVVERFIKTLKYEGVRRMIMPLLHRPARRELSLFLEWYNTHRPHTTVDGKTPNEVYDNQAPRNRRPRIEPRPNWPRASPCAKPQVLVAGKAGTRFDMGVDYLGGHRHLPMVSLHRAA